MRPRDRNTTDPRIPSALHERDPRAYSKRKAEYEEEHHVRSSIPPDSMNPPPRFDHDYLRALHSEIFGTPGDDGLKTKTSKIQDELKLVRSDVQNVLSAQLAQATAVARLEKCAGEERKADARHQRRMEVAAVFVVGLVGMIAALYVLSVAGVIGG